MHGTPHTRPPLWAYSRTLPQVVDLLVGLTICKIIILSNKRIP